MYIAVFDTFSGFAWLFSFTNFIDIFQELFIIKFVSIDLLYPCNVINELEVQNGPH